MVQCKVNTHRLSSCLSSRGVWAASHLHSVNKEAVHDMQYCIQAHATGGGEEREGGGKERRGKGEGMGSGEKKEGRGRGREQNSDIMEDEGVIAIYIPLFNSLSDIPG